MSNNEIPVGSRWRWSGTPDSRFWKVTGHAGESVFIVSSNGGSTCTSIASFRNATRIDASPAVKVGDVVYDPALLRDGTRFTWDAVVENRGPHTWRTEYGTMHDGNVKRIGVLVVALPEPAKAEAPCIECGLAGRRECRCDDVSKPVPPPARCATGCTPADPCCTEGVCPEWREREFPGVSGGISADWPPPARRHTPPPLRHDGACIAGWNGRVPRG